MILVGVAVSVVSSGLSADALNDFFSLLEQTFTLDDLARGILDNDILG
jgi:hypothetical protein